MNLHILNEGNTPTFYTVRNGKEFKSRVDVTACSENLISLIEDWKVELDKTSSDHNAITFTIKCKQVLEKRMVKSTKVYNTKKANWKKFKEHLSKELNSHNISVNNIKELDSREILNEYVDKYVYSVKEACKEAIPKIKRKEKIHLPWWSAELDELKRDTMTKKRRIRCAAARRRQHVIEVYLKAKEKYEKEAEKAQIKSWKEFCCTQDRESLWDGIYRVIRRSTYVYEDQPLVNDGILLTHKESVTLLANTFFPPDLESEDDAEQRMIREESNTSDKLLENDKQDPPFTREELVYVTRSFNPKKSPGPDGLTADICANAVLSDVEVFLAIVNRCLELHYFPVSWKEAVIVVLRKPGKSDYNHVKSYRPIGLLSIFGKILEKMMVRRLRWHLLPKANPRQYGFMPQRSTEDSLYDLVQHIKNNLANKLINVVISLDIEGAFDSAWWPAIKCQLAEKGCPQNIRKLVTSYLDGRKVRVRYADQEVCVGTSKGCVQGSVAGPTFWNLILDPLLDQLQKQAIYCQAFADDVVLVFSGRTSQTIETKANEALEYINAWGRTSKLTFAAHKTSAMVLTKKLKWDKPTLKMNGRTIVLVNELKVLGLTIDHKLTFNRHVSLSCMKSLNIYRCLAKMAKTTWGLKPEVVKIIYMAVIEPILMYAASVWADAAQKICVQKQLNAVQRGFAQKICRSYRTVSVHSALILSGLIPLDLRISEHAQLYEAKRGRPSRYLPEDRQVEQRIGILEAEHPAEIIDIGFSNLENLLPETIEVKQLSKTQIFTDGSKIEGKVGAAVSVWKGGVETASMKLKLEPYCSVFQAELYALFRAVEEISQGEDDDVCIFSDSRSALDLLGRHDSSHPLAHQARIIITRLIKSGKTLRFFWIRAHVGVEGNERADALP